jgi:hypothetical protein
MRYLFLAALFGAVFMSIDEAKAQNISATPTYGNVRLSGGFLPDPHIVQLTAGGAVEVARGSCDYGHVANAPDIDFYYDGNGSRTLYIYAVSDSDTMLLVNRPNGSWTCDDDSYGDLDPIVVIRNAPSGLYNIWVGTYGSTTAPAMLYISEIDPR